MKTGKSAVGLTRRLGLVSATALVVSNMVGTGIFASTGFMAGDLGQPLLILAVWAAGALFAFAGSLCYSELAINFPSSGGEYVYLRRAFGPTWGFMTGWVSFFAGFSAPIAAAALAFSHYLSAIAPCLANQILFTTGERLVACGLIALLTFANYFGVTYAARLQNFLTILKVVVLFTFVGLGLAVGHGAWQNFNLATTRTSTVPLSAQTLISLVWVMVAYSGWNAATYVAEEIKDPRRTLPRALAAGTAIVAVLYLAMNVLFIYSTPLKSMKGVFAIGSLAATNLFGLKAAGVFSGLMAVCIISTVSAMILIGPRVTYAMARDGAFFSWASQIHPRYKTPGAAILAQGACAVLMTFTAFPSLVFYIGLSLTFFTLVAVSSLFKFRKLKNWDALPAVDFAYPLIPTAYIFVSGVMVVYGIYWQPLPSLFAALTILAGAAVFRFLKFTQRS